METEEERRQRELKKAIDQATDESKNGFRALPGEIQPKTPLDKIPDPDPLTDAEQSLKDEQEKETLDLRAEHLFARVDFNKDQDRAYFKIVLNHQIRLDEYGDNPATRRVFEREVREHVTNRKHAEQLLDERLAEEALALEQKQAGKWVKKDKAPEQIKKTKFEKIEDRQKIELREATQDYFNEISSLIKAPNLTKEELANCVDKHFMFVQNMAINHYTELIQSPENPLSVEFMERMKPTEKDVEREKRRIEEDKKRIEEMQKRLEEAFINAAKDTETKKRYRRMMDNGQELTM